MPLSHLELAEIANRSYDNPSLVSGPSKALLLDTPEATVVAFAGSDDPLDFMMDGFAVPASMQGLGLVHRGFRDAYFKIRHPVLDRAVDAGKPIVVVGHSLGGAMAHFCAWDLGRVLPVKEVVTFGCPKGFTAKAAAKCKATTVNYIHGRDLVPDLPHFFHRPGADRYMDGEGRPIVGREPVTWPLVEELSSRLKDHLLLGRGYISALTAYLAALPTA